MKRMLLGIARLWQGICIGVCVSVVFGLAYIVILHEPGSAFYLFAGLAFFGGSLIGGIVAALKTQAHKRKAFFTSSGAVVGIVWILFLFTYVVLPQFARTNIQLPASCDGFDGSLDPPPQLIHTLPDESTGILVTSDAQTAVVAMIDPDGPPFGGSTFLLFAIVSERDPKG